MIELLPKILLAQVSPKLFRTCFLPFNYTISLTYRCNSRCLTCRVYEKTSQELSIAEYEKIFQSWGQAPYWVTFSGGEPFLRRDIVEIAELLYRYSCPKIVNIPTNGLLTDLIPLTVERLAERCPQTSFIINLSLDEIGEKHDEIRGVKGNYQKALDTYQALRQLKLPNLTLGIHTVISRYNVNNFEGIYTELMKLEPDSYVTEIAEQRVELGTVGEAIAPAPADYVRAIDFLMQQIRSRRFKGISRLTQALRLEYYQMVKKVLQEQRRVLPCYAGLASVQIAPDGDVWPCCIKAESMGNLRDYDYDLKRLLGSKTARELQRQIYQRDCYCPLANAAYTNMLGHWPSLLRAAWRLINWPGG